MHTIFSIFNNEDKYLFEFDSARKKYKLISNLKRKLHELNVKNEILNQRASSFIHNITSPLSFIYSELDSKENITKSVALNKAMAKSYLSDVLVQTKLYLRMLKNKQVDNMVDIFSVEDSILFIESAFSLRKSQITCKRPAEYSLRGSQFDFNSILVNLIQNAFDESKKNQVAGDFVFLKFYFSLEFMTIEVIDCCGGMNPDYVNALGKKIVSTKKGGGGMKGNKKTSDGKF